MAYERNKRGSRRSVIRRVWLYCFLFALPALLFSGFFLLQHSDAAIPVVLGIGGLLVYFAILGSSFIEGMMRPLQTLSNVVSSLREGDYSFRARGASSQDALGELAAEINTLADLLQRQRVRSLEATALLARILEVMNSPIFAFDSDEVLQLVNNAGMQLLGLPHVRCFGHTAHELGLEPLLAAPDQGIHSFGAKPTRWLLRKAVFRQVGVPHTLLLLADVSLPLQEEEQAAWKRLIRVLGHELSNSLAPIKSIAGSLRARVDQMHGNESALDDFLRGLGVIESRADSLHRFVQSYRLLAQFPAPQMKPISLTSLLERVALLEQRVPVQLEPGPPITLRADPDQLEQMFINLVVNAVDASLANQWTLVRVSWRSADGAAWINIEDTGIGIANPDNLFVPFYTTKPNGSGIGLALAQQIARAHGGEVTLTNREDGTGARATVRLPLE